MMEFQNSLSNNNNDRSSLPHPRHQRQRKYFDSADWALNKKNYQSPPAILSRTPSSDNSDSPVIVDVQEAQEVRESFRRNYLKQKLAEKPERKYFDSAEWATSSGDTTPAHSGYKNMPQQDTATVLTQKKLNKSRKYFDSADWMLSNHYVPQLYPKLSVV